MIGNKAELLENINENIAAVYSNKKGVAEIKDQLMKYRITGGRVEEILSDTSKLNEDIRELALFTEQFYIKTNIEALNPEQWFTKAELKAARSFDYILENAVEEITLPWEIQAISGHDGGYIGVISSKTVAKLMKSHILNYNAKIQREGKRIKRKDETITVPTIDKKNVKAMKELILKGELKRTTLTFNAEPLSSDTKEELIYNSKTNTLTVTSGTRLDVLDGWHRCLAAQQVYDIDPDIETYFNLNITNYTTSQAEKWQAQTAKGMRISKARIVEMEANSRANGVIQLLKADSELRGRISSSKGRVSVETGELVNYIVLSNAIDRHFKMTGKPDEYEVAEYLTKFFDFLFGYYPTEFGEPKNRDKNSLMTYNKMFSGYIALAAKMKKENIELKKIKEIIGNIDFNRNNPMWQEIGVTDDKGNISRSAKEENIEKYFMNIELSSFYQTN